MAANLYGLRDATASAFVEANALSRRLYWVNWTLVVLNVIWSSSGSRPSFPSSADLPPRWVKPMLVVDVEFRERTSDGLRHAC